jgi:hypothetical protein
MTPASRVLQTCCTLGAPALNRRWLVAFALVLVALAVSVGAPRISTTSPAAKRRRSTTAGFKHHEAARAYKGDRLCHHHWDQGPMAFAIPESVHLQCHGLLHWLTNGWPGPR